MQHPIQYKIVGRLNESDTFVFSALGDLPDIFQTAVVGEEKHIMRDRHNLRIKDLLIASSLLIGVIPIDCHYHQGANKMPFLAHFSHVRWVIYVFY
jgi:hypothetical protein